MYGISEQQAEYLELLQCYYGNLFDDMPHEYWEEQHKYTKQKISPVDKKVAFFEPIAKQVVEGVVAHTFGRDKFPDIVLNTNENVYLNEDIDEEQDKEETYKKLRTFMKAIEKQTFLDSVMIRSSRQSLLLGASAIAFRVIKGKFFIDVISRKDIQSVTFDPYNRDIVLSIREVWREKLPDPYDPTQTKQYWRCREINTQFEIDYEPVEVTNQPPDFNEAGVKRSVFHNLGFCPVVWMPYTDELSLFYGMIENLKQFSRFTSMIYLGIEKNMNPQFAFMSADAGEVEGIVRSSDNLWTLPEGTLKALSSMGNYQQALALRDKMRDAILKALRVSEIPVDNYQAAEALKMRLAPELNLVEECRVLFGEKALVSLVELMAKAAIIINGREMVDPNGEPILDEQGNQIVEDMKLGGHVEIPNNPNVYVSLVWGEIFTVTAQTRNMEIQTMVMATNSDGKSDPLVPKTAARDYLAAYIGVEDREALDKQLRTEKVRNLWWNHIEHVVEKSIDDGNPELGMLLMQLMAEDTQDDNIDTQKYIDLINSHAQEKELKVAPPQPIDIFPADTAVTGGGEGL